MRRIEALGGTSFLVALLERSTASSVVEGSAVALSNMALSDEGRSRSLLPGTPFDGASVSAESQRPRRAACAVSGEVCAGCKRRAA